MGAWTRYVGAMKSLGARWSITDTKDGKIVVYENLEAGIRFECGVCRRDTPVDMILEFILGEGDPGDLVFLNGLFYTQTQKEICA